jgi:hypothetical protein
MKTILNNKTLRIAAAALLAAALFVSSLALAPAPVFAQSGSPTPPAKVEKRDAAMEAAFVRLNDWSTKQAINLRKAGSAADKLQALIDKAKAKGKDVSALESALATFRGQLANAQASHDGAAAILAAHAGFDVNGKVTDPTAAHQTNLDARKNLMDAHVSLVKALADLRAEVRAWRNANRQVKATPAPQQ